MKLFIETALFLLAGLLLFAAGTFGATAFPLLEGESFFILLFLSLFLLLFIPLFSIFQKYFFLLPFLFFLLCFLFPEKRIFIILGILPTLACGGILLFPSRKKEMILFLFLLCGAGTGALPPIQKWSEGVLLSRFHFPVSTKNTAKEIPLFENPSAEKRGGTLLAFAVTFLQLGEESHPAPSLLLSVSSGGKMEKEHQKNLLHLFSLFSCKDVQYLSTSRTRDEKLKGNYSILFFRPKENKITLSYSLQQKTFWKYRKRLLSPNGIHAFCLPFSLPKKEQEELLRRLSPVFRELYKYNLLFETGSSLLLLSSDSPLTGNRPILAKRLEERYTILAHTLYPPGAFSLYMNEDGKDLSAVFRQEEREGLPGKYLSGKMGVIYNGGILLLLFLLPLLYFIFRYFQSGKGERKRGFRLFECTLFLTAFPLFFLLPTSFFPGGKAHIVILLFLFIAGVLFACSFAVFSKGNMAWETPQVVTFSRKKAFFYGLSFPLFTLLPYLLIYTPDTFFPLLTAFILPGIFFAGAGFFYGKYLGKILGEFREEENKKILALAAGGLLGGLIWSFFCLLPEQGGSLAVKTLFLLDLFLFSFSFMIPSFMNNISGKELI